MDAVSTPKGAFELLDRSGNVLHRVRVDKLPFRIGRALDNDLILDDVYSDAYHAELREVDGRLSLVDAGSVNGCYRHGNRQREASIAMEQRCELQIGHTQLRFRPQPETLAPAVADPLLGSRLHVFDGFRSASVAVILFGLLALLAAVFEATGTLRWMALAGTALSGVAVLAMWALIWSLVNRMVSHRFHYLAHLAIGGFGFAGSMLLDTLLGYLGFMFGFDASVGTLSTLFGTVLLAVVLYGHLRFVSSAAPRRLVAPAAAAALAFVALTELPGLGEDDFNSEPVASVLLKSPALAFGADSSESFYAEVDGLRARVDEARENP